MGGPAPNYLLNTLLSEPVQIPSEKRFDSLLNFIKAEEPGPKPFSISSEGHWFRVAWCGLTHSPWTGEDGCERLMLQSTVMKIMEKSEIFYNG